MDAAIILKLMNDISLSVTDVDVRDKFRSKLGDKIDNFWGILPVSVFNDTFSRYNNNEFLYAHKINGVRGILYYSSGYLLLQFRSGKVLKYKSTIDSDPCVYDIECCDGTIYILDCLYTEDPCGETFEERLGDISYFCRCNKKIGEYSVVPQKYYGVLHISELEDIKDEGIIMVRKRSTLFDRDTSYYKWKNPHECTYDLLIKDKKGFSSDGTYIADFDVKDGVWEINRTGKIVGERRKNCGNSNDTLINVFKNSLIDFKVFKDFLFNSIYIDVEYTIDDVRGSLSISDDNKESKIESENVIPFVADVPDIFSVKERSMRRDKYTIIPFEEYDDVGDILFLDDRNLSEKNVKEDFVGVKDYVYDQIRFNAYIKYCHNDVDIIVENIMIEVSGFNYRYTFGNQLYYIPSKISNDKQCIAFFLDKLDDVLKSNASRYKCAYNHINLIINDCLVVDMDDLLIIGSGISLAGEESCRRAISWLVDRDKVIIARKDGRSYIKRKNELLVDAKYNKYRIKREEK